MTNFEKVKEFHNRMKLLVGRDIADDALYDKCFGPICEELYEFEEAVSSHLYDEESELAIFSELTDLLYVVYSFAATYGFDIDEAFKRIHAQNMSKLDDNGNPVYRKDGKVMKGPNYRKANLEDLV